MSELSSAPPTSNQRSLNGAWSFALDPQDIGERETWYSRPLESTIQVPGSWEEQGYGNIPATRPLGAWSKSREYVGVAWYARELDIPAEWAGGTVQLILKGVRWQSRLWLDGQEIGVRESLSVPHGYDLTQHIKAGKRQRLAIRVDNRLIYPLGESHINSLETATQWGGITGGIDLSVRTAIAIDQIKCHPNVSEKRFDLEIELTSEAADTTVDVVISRADTGARFSGHTAVSTKFAAVAVQLDEAARL